MESHWKGVTFQTTDFVPRCSFFNQNRVSLPATKTLEVKKDIQISTKKKIKCPQSKFLRHKKQHSNIQKQKQTLIQKQKSPISSPNTLFTNNLVSFNQIPIRSKNFQIQRFVRTKSYNTTLNPIVHSPRQIKQIKKFQTNIPIQIKTRKHSTEQKMQNLNNSNISHLKTLSEFDLKMTQSLVDSTHYEDYCMQQSQIIIDFFNDEVQNNLTNTSKNSEIKIE